MQLSVPGLEDYLSRVAQLLEHYGVVLDLTPTAPLTLDEAPSGALSFALRGFLPDGQQPPLSILEIRERWRRLAPDHVERWEYEFEIIDHERDFRRAFHMHDVDRFIRRFHVAVHEHCEHPVGRAPCAHLAGYPVRDAYRGVELLLAIWTDKGIPDCTATPCLE